MKKVSRSRKLEKRSQKFFSYPGITAWNVLTRYCTFRQVREISGPHTSDKWGNNLPYATTTKNTTTVNKTNRFLRPLRVGSDLFQHYTQASWRTPGNKTIQLMKPEGPGHCGLISDRWCLRFSRWSYGGFSFSDNHWMFKCDSTEYHEFHDAYLLLS